jgi:hypothetical protein
VLSAPKAEISQNVFAIARALIAAQPDDEGHARSRKQSMVNRFLRR